jgi:hypothetical protein
MCDASTRHLIELAQFATDMRLPDVNVTAAEADRVICAEKWRKLVDNFTGS